MLVTFSKEFKMNYQNRKWIYFSHFQASDQKLLLQNVSHFYQEIQNSKIQKEFSKQEIELSKQ